MKKVFEICQNNNLNVSLTWQTINDYSIEIYKGYNDDPKQYIKEFDNPHYDQIVLLRGMEFASCCEHHMLPFIGHAHIAYIPDKKVIGLSKLARIFDCYSKRMQIQERLAQQVTDFLMDELNPLGAACIIKGVHLCTRMRGVMKQDSDMITSSLRGVFLEKDNPARSELLSLIGNI